MSSRRDIYKDYLRGLSPQRATRVLLLFGAGILVSEAVARWADPHYERTAGNSLHGARAIMQQVLEDRSPKLIACGDSTLLGVGIGDYRDTVPGRLQKLLPKVHLYNLALPGGDNTSTVMLLDALQKQGVAEVDRVVIEIVPVKFFVSDLQRPARKIKNPETLTELQRLIPAVTPQAWDLSIKPRSRSEELETVAQWKLGQVSRLYRHHDYFRTTTLGNYPIFYLAGRAIPRSIWSRFYGDKSEGTNRLGAHINGFNFNPQKAAPFRGIRVFFQTGYEGQYLEHAIALAHKISKKPPILWSFPIHFEYWKLDAAERASFKRALQAYEDYVRALAHKTGCQVMIVPSVSFQNPAWWTSTRLHFNAQGAAQIAAALEPSICSLYTCEENSPRLHADTP